MPPSSAGSLARRRGDLFPVEDSNSDGETRKLPGYSPEQLLAASLDGLPLGGARSPEPELELTESSWPDDLALEGHPALVDDDEDVVTQAAPLRSQPAPMSRLALPALAASLDGLPSRTPAPAAAPFERAVRSEPPGERLSERAASSRPPSGPAPSTPREPVPIVAASPAPPPDDPPPDGGPSRTSQAIVFTVMTLLGGALALVIVPDPRSQHAPPPAAPPAESPAILSARPAADPPPSEQAAPSSTASAASASASAAAPIALAGETMAEQAAREALTRLREGIGACVRDKIGTLPGSSPAVPRTLSLTRAPGYNALLPEWHTALWSCAGFQWTEPMRFQIQWQVQKRNVEGIGVAWVDHDGDGVPDRVLSFHATMGAGKGEIELGPIEPAEPAPAVLPVY